MSAPDGIRSKREVAAIKRLPPYKDTRCRDSSPHLGFAFDTETGQKCKIEYSSAYERACCECGELIEQKLFEQALKKFDDEVTHLAPRFDHKMYSKIQLGLALSNKHDMGLQEFEDAKSSLVDALSHDSSGSRHEELLLDLEKLFETYMVSLGVPEHDDDDSDGDCYGGDLEDEDVFPAYSKVQDAKVLRTVITLWLDYCKILMDTLDCGLQDFGEKHLDSLHTAFDALLKVDRSKESLKLVQSVSSELIKYGCGMEEESYALIFLAFHAETSEALGKKKRANKSYRALKEMDESFFPDGDKEWTKLVPGGDIDSRIQRTVGTPNTMTESI